MAPKTKKEILRDETFKQLKDIKNRVDPRTYAAFENDIFKAVGLSALNKMQGKIEAIKEMQSDKKYTKTAQAKKSMKKIRQKTKKLLNILNNHFKIILLKQVLK